MPKYVLMHTVETTLELHQKLASMVFLICTLRGTANLTADLLLLDWQISKHQPIMSQVALPKNFN